uniref:NADH-ubiquinone oxidoreductase chain 2 n=1 Tax=Titiscania limacina TaxID=200181 RepID=A0A1B2G3H0_9GAST|nr:NADH dehydrogenase subunit 2 [Titiscania limacina]
MYYLMPFGSGFVCVVLVGTMFSLSSVHWLGIWAGLELNLIGFVPLLVYSGAVSETQSGVKYLVVQALGSGMLMFGSLLMFSSAFAWEVESDFNPYGVLVVCFGLMVKLGVFPFHFWVPSVMAGASWNACLILATWQKIAPIFLLSSLTWAKELISFKIMFIIAGLSSLAGGVGGLNQTQMRPLLAYSSITHLGWMVYCMCFSQVGVKMYMCIYLLTTSMVIVLAWLVDCDVFSQASNFLKGKFFVYVTLMVLLLSMGGMPPFLGFAGKWIALSSGLGLAGILTASLLILGSLLSLSYYLGLMFSLLFSSVDTKQLSSSWVAWHDNTNIDSSLVLVIYLAGLFLILSLSGSLFILVEGLWFNFLYAVVFFYKSQSYWDFMYSIRNLVWVSRNCSEFAYSGWARATWCSSWSWPTV